MTKMNDGLGGEHFAACVVEASLSHPPYKVKRKILQDFSGHTDQILCHEIALRGMAEGSDKAHEVRRTVGSALAIGFHPLTVDGWKELLDESGTQSRI